MMGNNILDRTAMEAIAEITVRIPDMVKSLEKIEDIQSDMSQDLSAIKQKMNSMEQSIEQMPQRCPYREDISSISGINGRVKGIEDKMGTVREDISGLKTTDRIVGGANAAFTVLVQAIATFARDLIA